MDRAIRIVWWIGLIGALIATLAILKQVTLVLRALRDIHELAEHTREAARGISRNLDAIGRLPALAGPIGQVRQGAAAAAAAAGSLEQKAGALAPAAERG
jgi:hypothetical protein